MFHILVVDDDTSNLALAQKILGKEYRHNIYNQKDNLNQLL